MIESALLRVVRLVTLVVRAKLFGGSGADCKTLCILCGNLICIECFISRSVRVAQWGRL